MWKVMICDDEENMRIGIRQGLEKFSLETDVQFQVREVSSGEALLAQFSEDIDILFLDIKMSGMTGMEAAKKLRAKNAQVCIIFITTMAQYALEGYSVHAFGFLKKPVKYAQFRLQMQDTLHYLEPRREAAISLRSGGEVHRIPLHEIFFIEVLNHDLRFFRSEDSLCCHMTLNDVEAQLQERGFFRCHKSFLVNLSHVNRITSDGIQLSNGAEIPVSKHRRKEFLEEFVKYAGG